ncbi:hypothetical protein SAY87_000981 [Trapa incisa]|uniref:Uncharacterized protein n=1 Tax=Trapa incisa TaxID=236973 RepID=A0AAN7GHU8_9MYRT|nr:hypothetical protein SAY87_000981 [Trapa incisa]
MDPRLESRFLDANPQSWVQKDWIKKGPQYSSLSTLFLSNDFLNSSLEGHVATPSAAMDSKESVCVKMKTPDAVLEQCERALESLNNN